ncbi:hypothetical protein ON010_g1518 [Phytophthora cinnamomi]|nr:hypothetical protein ON010_g1518 [Phytophthora cinnamomi]
MTSAKTVPKHPAKAAPEPSLRVGTRHTGSTMRAMKMLQEDAGDQQTRPHLRDHAEPAAPVAHGPLAQVAEGLDRVGRQQHDFGHGHGRVDVGEGHEGHGHHGDGWPGAREVAGHTKRSNAVDAAEEVEGRLGVLEREEGLLGHRGEHLRRDQAEDVK